MSHAFEAQSQRLSSQSPPDNYVPGEPAAEGGGTSTSPPRAIRLWEPLPAEQVAELAATFGFSETDVAARAEQLSEGDQAWLGEQEASRALARRGVAGRLFFAPEGLGPESLAAHQAALYQRAITASIVLEVAERGYQEALTELELEALFQQQDQQHRVTARRALARRLIERDLAARFPDEVDPGDPFQVACSSFYSSAAFVAFRLLEAERQQRCLEAQREVSSPAGDLRGRLRRRLAQIGRRRQRERAAWTARQEAGHGPA